MPRVFRHDLVVPPDAIDAFGHVNNQRYIAWMQEVAMAHSAANGWPMERYLESSGAWVVRSHFIEYLRPAFAGDALEIYTWASSLALREVTRKYRFRRAGQALAKAETKWVYVDIRSGRPRRIPEELLASFDAVPDDDPELKHLIEE